MLSASNDDAPEGSCDRDVKFEMMDRLFLNSKRRFIIKSVQDFAVDKNTWIHILQQNYPQVEEIPELLTNVRNYVETKRGQKYIRNNFLSSQM